MGRCHLMPNFALCCSISWLPRGGCMTQFRLADDFLELFPDALIGLVIVAGIDNRADAQACAGILERQITETAARLPAEDLASLPTIAPWRAAYAKFGVKPSKFRSSIENLLRSAKSARLGSINPIVDLYNSVSLAYQLPVGGEDLDALAGDIVLTRAIGTESFVPLGGTAEEPPPAGAVIYRDDAGVICSCWNWREADRTKLTARPNVRCWSSSRFRRSRVPISTSP